MSLDDTKNAVVKCKRIYYQEHKDEFHPRKVQSGTVALTLSLSAYIQVAYITMAFFLFKPDWLVAIRSLGTDCNGAPKWVHCAGGEPE